MANVTNNSTSNSSYEKIISTVPSSQCIPWLVVSITDCLATVILNIITIIVFVKQRQLQRRSTYLIIHLAIVDLLVGAVSGSLNLAFKISRYCDLWEDHFDTAEQSLYLIYIHAFILLFHSLSIMNLAAISLERLHATFCPLEHRLLSTWHYGVIIFVIWICPTLVESVPLILYKSMKWTLTAMTIYYDIRSSLCLLVLLVICISYILIFIKVRCGSHLQHHGAANRERKLTTTLLVVTLVSLLTWLPGVIFFFFMFRSYLEMSIKTRFHIEMAFSVLIVANSLVNPILYATRMAEFRTVIFQLFRRQSSHRETRDIELNPRNM